MNKQNNPDETPWTTDQMRQNASTWTLEGDAKLLLYLKAFSKNLCERSKDTKRKIESMASTLDYTQVSLGNSTNRFHALQHSQFVESRVYEEDITAPVQKEEIKQEEVKTDPATIAKQAVMCGLKLMETEYTKIPIKYIENSTETIKYKYVLKDKYSQRALPPRIGSKEFLASLNPSESDSEGGLGSSRSHSPSVASSQSKSYSPLPGTTASIKSDNTILSSNSDARAQNNLFGHSGSEDEGDIFSSPQARNNRLPDTYSNNSTSSYDRISPNKIPVLPTRNEYPILFNDGPPILDEDETPGLFDEEEKLFDTNENKSKKHLKTPNIFHDQIISKPKVVNLFDDEPPEDLTYGSKSHMNNSVHTNLFSNDDELSDEDLFTEKSINGPKDKIYSEEPPEPITNSMKGGAVKKTNKNASKTIDLFAESDEDEDLFATRKTKKDVKEKTKISLFEDDDIAIDTNAFAKNTKNTTLNLFEDEPPLDFGIMEKHSEKVMSKKFSLFSDSDDEEEDIFANLVKNEIPKKVRLDENVKPSYGIFESDDIVKEISSSDAKNDILKSEDVKSTNANNGIANDNITKEISSSDIKNNILKSIGPINSSRNLSKTIDLFADEDDLFSDGPSNKSNIISSNTKTELSTKKSDGFNEKLDSEQPVNKSKKVMDDLFGSSDDETSESLFAVKKKTIDKSVVEPNKSTVKSESKSNKSTVKSESKSIKPAVKSRNKSEIAATPKAKVRSKIVGVFEDPIFRDDKIEEMPESVEDKSLRKVSDDKIVQDTKVVAVNSEIMKRDEKSNESDEQKVADDVKKVNEISKNDEIIKDDVVNKHKIVENISGTNVKKNIVTETKNKITENISSNNDSEITTEKDIVKHKIIENTNVNAKNNIVTQTGTKNKITETGKAAKTLIEKDTIKPKLGEGDFVPDINHEAARKKSLYEEVATNIALFEDEPPADIFNHENTRNNVLSLFDDDPDDDLDFFRTLNKSLETTKSFSNVGLFDSEPPPVEDKKNKVKVDVIDKLFGADKDNELFNDTNYSVNEERNEVDATIVNTDDINKDKSNKLFKNANNSLDEEQNKLDKSLADTNNSMNEKKDRFDKPFNEHKSNKLFNDTSNEEQERLDKPFAEDKSKDKLFGNSNNSKQNKAITNIDKLFNDNEFNNDDDEDLFKIAEKKSARSEKTSKTNEGGKLSKTLNIDVTALLPGARPPQIRASTGDDLSASKFGDRLSGSKFDKVAWGPAVEIVGSSTESNGNGVLDVVDATRTLHNSAIKDRAKIRTKRRPQSRSARQEAARKSLLLEEDYQESQENQEQNAHRTIMDQNDKEQEEIGSEKSEAAPMSTDAPLEQNKTPETEFTGVITFREDIEKPVKLNEDVYSVLKSSNNHDNNQSDNSRSDTNTKDDSIVSPSTEEDDIFKIDKLADDDTLKVDEFNTIFNDSDNSDNLIEDSDESESDFRRTSDIKSKKAFNLIEDKSKKSVESSAISVSRSLKSVAENLDIPRTTQSSSDIEIVTNSLGPDIINDTLDNIFNTGTKDHENMNKDVVDKLSTLAIDGSAEGLNSGKTSKDILFDSDLEEDIFTTVKPMPFGKEVSHKGDAKVENLLSESNKTTLDLFGVRKNRKTDNLFSDTDEDDEDLFKTSSSKTRVESKSNRENEVTKSKGPKVTSLFGESDSDDDLFKTPSNKLP